MVFNEHDEDEKVIAKVESGGNAEIYRCLIAGCDTPTCTCEEVTVLFFAEQDIEKKTPLHSIRIDWHKRTLGGPASEEGNSETMAFAKRLRPQLDADDFQYLSSIHYNIKYEATLNARPETIEAEFDSATIEQGMLCAYLQILPYAQQLTATIGNEFALFSDIYCLASQCNCTESVISLVTRKKNGKRLKERCLLRVDYKAKIWKFHENISWKDSIDVVQAAAEEQIEAFYETLEKRHLHLRAIYRHNKSRSPSAQPRIASKTVGRNEPCPCGSGKKYKKCCLRNE